MLFGPRRKNTDDGSRHFLVRMQAGGITALIEGVPTKVGFVTTRYTRAHTESDAQKAAWALVQEQSAALGTGAPILQRVEVIELSPGYRGPRPREGFTIYDE